MPQYTPPLRDMQFLMQEVLDLPSRFAKLPAFADVDNGPVAMVKDGNDRLYARDGLTASMRVLKPGGLAAFWSASQDSKFSKRLTQAGFNVEVFAAKSHEQARRPSHTIFVGQKPVPKVITGKKR